jgi:FKBP-type peptidyl-prolyl cis-trans isomerase 2
MKVKKNCLVRVQYRITDDEGLEIDASTPSTPLEFVCGRGDVVSGLERGVIGLEVGAKKRITIPPEDAYGARDPKLLKELPRAGFPAHLELVEGQRFSYRSARNAELTYCVREIRSDTILADFNHPLAGKALHYDVEIVGVSEDTGEGK